MAYANYLASVAEEQVASLADDPSRALDPHALVVVSHLVPYWVQVQPLGKLLVEAIDGGHVLCAALWHPLRPPVYHPPGRVVGLDGELSRAWERAASAHPVPETDWYRIEIGKVLKVYRDAAEHGLCVVSALAPPVDAERASRVHVPLKTTPAAP